MDMDKSPHKLSTRYCHNATTIRNGANTAPLFLICIVNTSQELHNRRVDPSFSNRAQKALWARGREETTCDWSFASRIQASYAACSTNETGKHHVHRLLVVHVRLFVITLYGFLVVRYAPNIPRLYLGQTTECLINMGGQRYFISLPH